MADGNGFFGGFSLLLLFLRIFLDTPLRKPAGGQVLIEVYMISALFNVGVAHKVKCEGECALYMLDQVRQDDRGASCAVSP